MKIDRITFDHVHEWARMRATLWPGFSVERAADDGIPLYLSGNARAAAFMCQTGNGEPVGFAEATLRSDYVSGCETSPVLFLEGIFVKPEQRRRGGARLLCDAVAAWGLSMGCCEFASDALLENAESHKFHAALGFQETERVVFFRRSLKVC